MAWCVLRIVVHFDGTFFLVEAMMTWNTVLEDCGEQMSCSCVDSDSKPRPNSYEINALGRDKIV